MKNPATGEVTEVHCTYDPATRGGDAPDGRKVKGTLHWVSARHALDAEVRLYEYLFTKKSPGDAPEGGAVAVGAVLALVRLESKWVPPQAPPGSPPEGPPASKE